MFQSTINQSNEVVGVNTPTAQDEQFVKTEIERRKTISVEEKNGIKKFIQDLVHRGQVADVGENIFHRHTHRIVGYESDLTPILMRIKF